MGGGFSRVVTVCFCGLGNVVWDVLENGTILGYHVFFCANFEFRFIGIEHTGTLVLRVLFGFFL